MRALSVRQPWAERILLGHKTIEARSQRTNLRERVHIYAVRNRIEAEDAGRTTRGGPRWPESDDPRRLVAWQETARIIVHEVPP